MAEPEEIVSFLDEAIKKSMPLFGKKALVTAGPTYEAIDPVRFIGNHSSGKMGFAIADELTRLGADVTLISGPSAQKSNFPVKRIDVVSAQDMFNACTSIFEETDITVMCAAVADYRPKIVATQKIKKQESEFTLELEKTIDVLASLGKIKKENQTLVGFALETNDEENYAKGQTRKEKS